MGFVAYEVSLEIVKSVAPVIHMMARRDRALADQMRRAASSVPLEIAEGSRRTGRDRKHSPPAAPTSFAPRYASRSRGVTSIFSRRSQSTLSSIASSGCAGA